MTTITKSLTVLNDAFKMNQTDFWSKMKEIRNDIRKGNHVSIVEPYIDNITNIRYEARHLELYNETDYNAWYEAYFAVRYNNDRKLRFMR